MPKIRRFSRYNFALKLTTPSTGSNLEKYKKWKSGEVEITYTKADSSNPGSFDLVYVYPFALDGVTAKFTTTVSNRAMTAINDVLGGASTLNHKTLAADEVATGAIWDPYKANVRKKGTGEGTEQTSKITGKKYKQKSGVAAYTYPFGRASATDDLLTRMKAIKNAAKAKSCIVSFLPERFYDA
ncbi:hypothetical protein C7H19_09470 [Aphanothece hegewaldii CCALA 016]|uniref:Uncharacterized protein n=1 Tax=Aphanothece hegewaldii CCALA 016 TaxID=2107694 RepID=A0A2T1LZD0_9CHRO|nr:hypothetical protein [Aphanothece hegewaldii]PSF37762.1 hypothetical protein C7H19_09470 [Aphanothece hegewaldii CCALA 016]